MFNTASQKTKAAQIERALRRTWVKCTETEETEKFLVNLLSEGVGVQSDEEFLKTEAGKRKYGSMDEKSKRAVREVLTKGKLEDCRKGGTTLRKKRGKLRKQLSELVSKRHYNNECSKVKKHCVLVRAKARRQKEKKLKWLVEKYSDKGFIKKAELPDNIKEFEKCKVFSDILEKEEVDGVEIVLMEGEVINLSDCERKLLARGPNYCILKSVNEEGFCCCLESAIVKHKWETYDDDS